MVNSILKRFTSELFSDDLSENSPIFKNAQKQEIIHFKSLLKGRKKLNGLTAFKTKNILSRIVKNIKDDNQRGSDFSGLLQNKFLAKFKQDNKLSVFRNLEIKKVEKKDSNSFEKIKDNEEDS